MSNTAATKAGTGAGALLVISSTPATLASPAPAPVNPPTAYTLAPASTPTGIAVLQLKDFTMPTQKWAYDNTTNLGSPTVGTGVQAESLPTVMDPGEFSCTGIFLPSDPGLVAIQSAFATGIAQAFQVQLPALAGQSTEGNVYAFNAFIQENPLPQTVSADKSVTIKIGLKLNSLITVKQGS